MKNTYHVFFLTVPYIDLCLLSPSGSVASTTWGFNLIAPQMGLRGWTWYAQARQAEEPRHAPIASTQTLTIQPAPSGFISHISNAVAGNRTLIGGKWNI